MFPDVYTVRQVQGELDKIIEQGVVNLVELLNNDENKHSTKEDSDQQVKKEVGSAIGFLKLYLRFKFLKYFNGKEPITTTTKQQN